MTKQQRYPRTKSSTVSKGKMLERIVASMHEREGVAVETNVWLPPVGGSGSKREIDVLLSSEVCGYPVRCAIECKNEAKQSGVTYIDAFVGKLTYVGIPSQCGIFVSARGYTKAAIERAKAAGIRLLLFEDAARGLDATISQAVQTIIYLLPVVNGIEFQNFVFQPMEASEIQIFYDKDGNACEALPDLIWQAWLDGSAPMSIGEHHIAFDAPNGAFHRYGDKLVPVTNVRATINVLGLIQQFTGTVSGGSLRNVAEGIVERQQIKAQFAKPAAGKYHLKTITSEEELQQLYNNKAIVAVRRRIRLPRLNYWNSFYWPPSDRVAAFITERMRAFEAGLIPDPRPFNIVELEGTDLSTVFEPIGTAYRVAPSL